jgi:hypothetical protein
MDFQFLTEILFEPIEIIWSEIWKGLLQKLFLLRRELESANKLSDSFQTCENDVFSTEGVLPEENLKSGLILMLIVLKVGIGASELVQVVEE